MWLFNHDEIKVNHVSKMGLRWLILYACDVWQRLAPGTTAHQQRFLINGISVGNATNDAETTWAWNISSRINSEFYSNWDCAYYEPNLFSNFVNATHLTHGQTCIRLYIKELRDTDSHAFQVDVFYHQYKQILPPFTKHCQIFMGPVSLRRMTSQFKDIVTHIQT